MNCAQKPVDRILTDFGISDPVKFLEDIQDGFVVGFSNDPTVDVIGNIELARERASKSLNRSK